MARVVSFGQRLPAAVPRHHVCPAVRRLFESEPEEDQSPASTRLSRRPSAPAARRPAPSPIVSDGFVVLKFSCFGRASQAGVYRLAMSSCPAQLRPKSPIPSCTISSQRTRHAV
jgi:hypothetical protein